MTTILFTPGRSRCTNSPAVKISDLGVDGAGCWASRESEEVTSGGGAGAAAPVAKRCIIFSSVCDLSWSDRTCEFGLNFPLKLHDRPSNFAHLGRKWIFWLLPILSNIFPSAKRQPITRNRRFPAPNFAHFCTK